MHEVIRTLSLPEAAKFLSIHKETARRLAACCEVPAAKVGRSWCFFEEDLVTYLRSHYYDIASQSVVPNRSKIIWHSTKEKTFIGLTSATMVKECNAALGRVIN